MSGTLDFQLARLTAQSKNSDPKMPGGGRPETPVEIIRLMAGHIQSLPAYYAVMARKCQDDLAIKHLHDVALALSWREWRKNERRYKTRISVERLNRVTEAAILTYLCPYYEKNGETKPRDDEWAAKYAKTTDEKWAKDFAAHARIVLNRLMDLEAEGQRDMNKFWGAWKSAKQPETLDAA